jgi:hypothetical protein
VPSRIPVVLAALVAAVGLVLAAVALTTTVDNDEAAEFPPRSTSGPTSTAGVEGDESTTASPTTETTLDSTVASSSSTTTTTTTEATTTTERAPERNLLGGDSPEDGLMPDLVCFDLQAAQDEVQDHGVFFSRSEDASGDGRRQLWDRNWVVIDQDPAPGTPIGERDAVFYVLKDDEPHGC